MPHTKRTGSEKNPKGAQSPASSVPSAQDMADFLESVHAVAKLERRSEIKLTLDTVRQIVERLRSPALPRGGNAKSWRENRHLDDSIRKARAYKEKLRKKGMTATEAEAKAAEKFAPALKMAQSTFQRAMQTNSDD